MVEENAVFFEDEIEDIFAEIEPGVCLPGPVTPDFIKKNLLKRYINSAISIGAGFDSSKRATLDADRSIAVLTGKGILRQEYYPERLKRILQAAAESGQNIENQLFYEYIVLNVKNFLVNTDDLVAAWFREQHLAYKPFGGIQFLNSEDTHTKGVVENLTMKRPKINADMVSATLNAQNRIYPAFVKSVNYGLLRSSRAYPLMELEFRNFKQIKEKYEGPKRPAAWSEVKYCQLPPKTDPAAKVRIKDDHMDAGAWSHDATLDVITPRRIAPIKQRFFNLHL